MLTQLRQFCGKGTYRTSNRLSDNWIENYLTTEEFVRNEVVGWLSRRNYEFPHIAPTRGRPPVSGGRGRPLAVKPPDVIAKRRGQNYYFFVEAKGDPATSTKFHGLIGEIVIQMARKTPADYAIACPISYKRTILSLLRLRSWKHVDFRILIVKGRRNVIELRPTAYGWKRLHNL